METRLDKAMDLPTNTLIDIGGAEYVITNVTPTTNNNVIISAHMVEDVDRSLMIIVAAYRYFNYKTR